MEGGAVTLARAYTELDFRPNLIIADDMLDLTTFLALTRSKSAEIPVALYMHENQLTYPLHHDKTQGAMRNMGGKRDRHLVFVNYSSMLAADRVFFNSRHHLDSWFGALPNFLKNYPEYNELETVDALRAKARVLHVGVDALDGIATGEKPQPPLILWNQRWEYDKNPNMFLDALLALHARQLNFRVAFCGENFSQNPVAFERATAILGDRVVHVGFASAEKYRQLLSQTALTFSTAKHEYFGISMVEAMLAGAYVLLPPRLSYPELVPNALQQAVFYRGYHDLVNKAEAVLQDADRRHSVGQQLRQHALRFSWEQLSPVYDGVFEQITVDS